MSKSDKPAAQVSRARGIYLLPNLFTLIALFAGFYAIVAAMRGRFENAAIAIYVAMIMDSLDGRVARLTNTQTAFGAQLDSLSDMVSFGVAPALVIYSWSLFDLGKLGWLSAFVFAVATALRLARFNIQDTTSRRYFRGMPCPAGAGVIAGMVWVGQEYGMATGMISLVIAAVTVVCGILMVSNIRYRSFKDLDLRHHVPFVAILLIVLIFILISIDPPRILFGIFVVYLLSGPVAALWRLWHRAHIS